jgi:hypothetical protein
VELCVAILTQIVTILFEVTNFPVEITGVPSYVIHDKQSWLANSNASLQQLALLHIDTCR